MAQRLGARLAACPWIWWGWLLIWAVLLFVLSSESSPETGPEFPFKDKLLHCIYFSGGAFCFLLGRWGNAISFSASRFAAAGMLFTAIAGAIDEFHQTYTVGRVGNDFHDWLADVSGGLLGAMIAVWFLTWVRRTVAVAAE